MRGVHKLDLSMQKKQGMFVFMHITENKIYDAQSACMQNIDSLI